MADQSILDTIRQFEKTLEIPKDPKKREPKPGTLLEQVVRVKLTEHDIRKRARRRLARLIDGNRYGYVKVDKQTFTRDHGIRRFRCVCDCGREVMLTTMEVHQRAAVKSGCMHADCQYGSMEAKMLFNPKFALWAQLNFLLSRNPHEVANEWGGTAYECERVEETEGHATFIEEVWPLIEEGLERGAWWMHRIDTILPYSAINVRFDTFPDPEVVQITEGTVRYGDMVYSLERLSDMFNLPLERLAELRKAIISDHVLMDKIIEEGEL